MIHGVVHNMLIEIEDEKTWPLEVRNIFDINAEIIELSQAHEIERSCSSELGYLQSSYPPFLLNQVKANFDSIVDEVNLQIAGCDVIGYHCTRLLDHEIEEIKKSGLKLPSRALLQERLKKAHERGILHQNLINNILKNNEYLNMPVRENILHFVCGISALRGEGVSKFFQCWGGEAVYNSHELSEHKDILFRLGVPVIIQVKVKPKEDIGKKLAFAYLIARGIQTEDEPGFGHHCRQPLFPDSILKIINFHDPEFLELTDYLSWQSEKQPI